MARSQSDALRIRRELSHPASPDQRTHPPHTSHARATSPFTTSTSSTTSSPHARSDCSLLSLWNHSVTHLHIQRPLRPHGPQASPSSTPARAPIVDAVKRSFDTALHGFLYCRLL